MKNKLLGIVLIVLVIANMVTLGVFWYYRIHHTPPETGANAPGGRGAASAFIIKQVGLSSTQQAAYRELVMQHQQKVRAIRDQLHTAKDSFFDLLSDSNASPAKVDELSSTIGQLEKEIDMLTFEHFRQVRAICTPDQKIKLDNCIKQVLRMMAPQGGGGPQGPPPQGEGRNHGTPGELPPPPGEGPPPQGDRLPPPPQQ
jgi:Spy/CpxP family protein refolding chaperone